MFKFTTFVLLCTTLAGLVLGHGSVTTPTPRKLGSAAQTACGTAVYNKLKSDLNGPIENSVAVEDGSYNATACPLYFCKGYQFADNTANTRKYTAGSIVTFHVDLQAHHTGTANVSVVDLATQKTKGSPLFYWPVYANESVGPSQWPANETDFNVTIPNLGTQCATSGQCAIQWWWWAYSNGQTYESCVDFTQ